MSFDPLPWTRVGDPPADALMARLQAEHGIADVDPLLLRMVREADPVPSGLPDELRAFLADTHRPHRGQEAEAVARAERFFGAHGPSIVMLLGFASLPWTYSLRDGASILVRTGQLTRHAHRRVLETTQFVVDAFAGGGLGPQGAGLRDAQKVRLMHTAIRSYVLQSGRWDVASRGVPVCQADLLATLCSFTHVVLDGLGRMGVEVEPDDAEAWVVAWRVLGRNLGIDEQLLPVDAADAAAKTWALEAARAGDSDDGKQLAAALCAFLESLGPPGVLGAMVPTQIRFFLGDQRGDWLGLPPANASRFVIRAINAVDAALHDVEDRVPLFESAGSLLGHAIIRGLLAAERGGTRPPFAIPPSLRTTWNLGD